MFRKSFTLSVLTERRVFAPYGMEGGRDGIKGRNTLIMANGREVNNFIDKTFQTDILQSTTMCLMLLMCLANVRFLLFFYVT